MSEQPPLIVHIIYRLGVGGLENGLVNVINRLPADQFRHAIICLTDSTDFKQRIQRTDVAVYELHKAPGWDWRAFAQVWRWLRAWRPAIVHSRNLAAMEFQLCAWAAGVPYRIHSEHGWDVYDPDGNNKIYQAERRCLSVLVQKVVPLSRQIEDYLLNRAGIKRNKILRICNGVDASIFYPASTKVLPQDMPELFNNSVLFGSVGRMHGVKDQLTLTQAFILASQFSSEFRNRAKLCLIGDGPLRAQADALLRQAGLRDRAWLPGERSDIAALLRCLDVFVLPSLAEGISNTILEAMASGLPVVATNVGGNPELVRDGENGVLVAAGQPQAMAEALLRLFDCAELRATMGAAALQRVAQEFSLDGMMERYRQLYLAGL
jgi:sugar transferase (PEP-CTERM/EpsH1 system associated)